MLANAGDVNVVIDKKIANAKRELDIVMKRVDGIRASLDLKIKQYQNAKTAPKAMGILNGARQDFEDLKGLARTPEMVWQWERETHSRFGEIQVRCVGFDALEVTNDQGRVIGRLNGVLAEEYDLAGNRLRDEKGQERPTFSYATTRPAAERPHRVRAYYGMRWVIENQGFRELTQRWALDHLASRRFNALNSRMGFAFMLYNAERVLRMTYPGPWAEHRQRLQLLGQRDLLGGPSIAVYTQEGHLGAYTPEAYGQLIAERERNRIVSTLREGLARGQSLERLLDQVQLNPPPKA